MHENIIKMMDFCSYAADKDVDACAISIDAVKAFDRVSRRLLFELYDVLCGGEQVVCCRNSRSPGRRYTVTAVCTQTVKGGRRNGAPVRRGVGRIRVARNIRNRKLWPRTGIEGEMISCDDGVQDSIAT